MNGLTSEMVTLKTRLRATWMAGDYGHFAQYLEAGALEFLERLNVQPGTRLLDVACGAGQISIPAARAGADVTGIDIASNLIEQAQARAASEGLTIRFDEGDAELLPYADADFDVVASLIGAMFAPRAERVVAELLRVCRPGGRIAMANWTPEGHVGQMFRAIANYISSSPLVESPLKWGDEATVRERFSGRVQSLSFTKRYYPMRYPFPPRDVVAFFCTYYGPTVRAMADLDADGQAGLKRALQELWTVNNLARDGKSTYVEAEYLEIVATRA